MLERGLVYQFNPPVPVLCLNCSEDLTEQVKKSLMIYLGKLDGQDFFIYDNPPQCPSCNFSLRYHHERQFNIEVTDEFAKLLDKKS